MDYCESCGARAPIKYVEFYQNIGLLVLRLTKSVKGNLCKDCINRYFWPFTGITLILGWWGVISFFFTPIILLNNTIRYIFTLGLKAPIDSSPIAPPKRFFDEHDTRAKAARLADDGIRLAERGRLDEATERFRQALEIQPKNGIFHYNLALAYMSKENSREALEELKLSIRFEPNYTDSYFALATCIKLLGPPWKAAACYRAYLDFAKSGDKANVAKMRLAELGHNALNFNEQQWLDSAKEEYDRFIQQMGSTGTTLGRSLADKKPESTGELVHGLTQWFADVAYSKALEWAAPHFENGMKLMDQSKWGAAIIQLILGLEILPHDQVAISALANAYAFSGEYEQAARILNLIDLERAGPEMRMVIAEKERSLREYIHTKRPDIGQRPPTITPSAALKSKPPAKLRLKPLVASQSQRDDANHRLQQIWDKWAHIKPSLEAERECSEVATAISQQLADLSALIGSAGWFDKSTGYEIGKEIGEVVGRMIRLTYMVGLEYGTMIKGQSHDAAQTTPPSTLPNDARALLATAAKPAAELAVLLIEKCRSSGLLAEESAQSFREHIPGLVVAGAARCYFAGLGIPSEQQDT